MTLIFLVEPRSSRGGKETVRGALPSPSKQPKSRQRALASSPAGSEPELSLVFSQKTFLHWFNSVPCTRLQVPAFGSWFPTELRCRQVHRAKGSEPVSTRGRKPEPCTHTDTHMCTCTPSLGTLAKHLPMAGGRQPAQSVSPKDPDGAGGGLGRLEHPEMGVSLGEDLHFQGAASTHSQPWACPCGRVPPGEAGRGGRQVAWCP